MKQYLSKLAKELNGKIRLIHMGLTLQFQELTEKAEHLEGTVSCEYSGETSTMTLEVKENTITVLTIHVIEQDFPFINTVLGFEAFAKQKGPIEDAEYYKDERNYIYSDGFRLFTAGIRYRYSGALTEAGLLDRIQKTVSFSYEFNDYLKQLTHRRPAKVRDEQVSERIRYLIVEEGLAGANHTEDQKLIEKEETWELMNTFSLSDADGLLKDEVPVILSFGRTDDEMAAEMLIEAKATHKIEVYQQGAVSMALKCQAEKIDYADEYIREEEKLFFKYKIYANHQYDSERIAAFIRKMAKTAANLTFRL